MNKYGFLFEDNNNKIKTTVYQYTCECGNFSKYKLELYDPYTNKYGLYWRVDESIYDEEGSKWDTYTGYCTFAYGCRVLLRNSPEFKEEYKKRIEEICEYERQQWLYHTNMDAWNILNNPHLYVNEEEQ